MAEQHVPAALDHVQLGGRAPGRDHVRVRDRHVAVLGAVPDVRRHRHARDIDVPPPREQPEVAGCGPRCRPGRVAQVVEECLTHVRVVAKQAGVRLGEHAREPVQALLRLLPASPQGRREQRVRDRLGAAGHPGHEPLGRQSGIARHERRHAADGGHRAEPAGQQHAACQRRRPAARQADDRARLQARVRHDLAKVAGAGGDRSTGVVGRPAVARAIGQDQRDAALAGGAGERGDLPR